jgi:CBS domain containing-hemolysin-like protein
VPVLQLRPFETVANAMARMQRIQKEMAIVTGFGGGLLGMVTLRDLLDEVVGEIS